MSMGFVGMAIICAAALVANIVVEIYFRKNKTHNKA